MDIAPIEILGLPVLTPIFGFSQITAPEITAEVEDIVEGNWFYPRKVIKRGSVSSITLSRGATYYDSDFYRWFRAALTGDTENFQSKFYNTATMIGAGSPGKSAGGAAAQAIGGLAGLFGFPRIGGPSPRRDMILIQYFSHAPTMDSIGGIATGIVQTEIIATQLTSSFGSLGSLTTAIETAVAAAGEEIPNIRPFRVAARAWKLRGCIPTRYKTGSDFDASGIEVSIMELEFELEGVEEISLAG